jgi:AraC family ethanolamine operon transcriptional activator
MNSNGVFCWGKAHEGSARMNSERHFASTPRDHGNDTVTRSDVQAHQLRRHFSAENLDDVGGYSRVGGWQIGAMQTTPGTLACTRNELILEGLQWLDEDLRNVTLSMFGNPPADSIVFGVVLRGGPTVRVNGQTWLDCEIAIGSDHGPAEVLLPPAQIVTLAVRRELLANHVQLRDGSRLRDCGLDAQLMLIRNPALVAVTRTRLARLAGDIATQFQNEPMSAAQGHAMRSEILDVLANIVVATGRGRDDRVAIRRSLQVEVVRQARRRVAESAAEVLQVEDLCRATRVSRRTLQRCFLNVVGVTPLHYLRLNRLTHARSMLLDATPGQRIQDVLGVLGIWHAGRFAAEYRALFGELPSDTLRDARRH